MTYLWNNGHILCFKHFISHLLLQSNNLHYPVFVKLICLKYNKKYQVLSLNVKLENKNYLLP